jgi:hypothetical protein
VWEFSNIKFEIQNASAVLTKTTSKPSRFPLSYGISQETQGQKQEQSEAKAMTADPSKSIVPPVFHSPLFITGSGNGELCIISG